MQKVINILSRIETWIVFFFILRLFAITNPPLETAHSWRQTTVLMSARNYYETDTNILYPRLDFAGEKSGITGMEFPLLNYLIYLVSIPFGYAHWYGRLIVLLFSVMGNWFFYLLSRKYFGERTAFFSTLILIGSLWFTFSRKAMPDIPAISLVMAGLYFGLKYLTEKSSSVNLLLYALFTGLGLLVKIPAVYLLILMIYPFFSREVLRRKKLHFAGATFLAVLPSAFWYFIWVPYLKAEFQFPHYFMGVSALQGIQQLVADWPNTLKRFYESALMFSGFAAFIGGIVLAFVKKDKRLLLVFGTSLFAFALMMTKMGRNFPLHNYYILIFVPVMALVAGYLISNIRIKYLAVLAVSIIITENILANWTDFSPRDERLEMNRLEALLDSIAEEDARIAVNCAPDPTALYMAHRKGWVSYNHELKQKDYRDSLIEKNCRYILIMKQSDGQNIQLNYPVVFEDPYFKVYKLYTD